MGARTGKAYLEGLRDDRHIYVNGDPINNRILYYGTDRRKECTALVQRLLESLKEH